MPLVPYDNITGKRYGRLVALRRVEKKWEFACDCGAVKIIWATNVKRGHTQSCGCFAKEVKSAASAKANTRHGMTNSKEYRAWQSFLQRCNNPKDKDFRNYGGRGIRVCERWNNFEAFIEDMGRKPSDSHSIDRVDVNGDYSPENCRWATIDQQARNRRNNIKIQAFGREGCLADFVNPYSREYRKVCGRIKRGCDPAEAILAFGGEARI